MKKTARRVKKGDVWLLENLSAIGHVMQGRRPHVVVTQISGETVTLAPCSSVPKKKFQKFTVELQPSRQNGLTTVSYVLIVQSFAADISLLQSRIGHLVDGDMARIQVELVKYVTE